ncbi:MAG: prepilin peptidase [Promethearchaeota archaeon]
MVLIWIFLIGLFLIECVYNDLNYKKIPNSILKYTFAYCVFQNILEIIVYFNIIHEYLTLKLITLVLVFIISFALFYFKLIGGGDGKMMIISFMLIPIYYVIIFLKYFFFLFFAFLLLIIIFTAICRLISKKNKGLELFIPQIYVRKGKSNLII